MKPQLIIAVVALSSALVAPIAWAQQAENPTPNPAPTGAAPAPTTFDPNAIIATQPTAAGPAVLGAVGGITAPVVAAVGALVGATIATTGGSSTSGTTGTTGTN
jgi:hypothetical protein